MHSDEESGGGATKTCDSELTSSLMGIYSNCSIVMLLIVLFFKLTDNEQHDYGTIRLLSKEGII